MLRWGGLGVGLLSLLSQLRARALFLVIDASAEEGGLGGANII